MIVGRAIGWIFLLAGGAVLVRDLLVWIDTKHWAPIALGQLWYELNRSSLNFLQAVIQRYIHPFLWDPIIVSILLSWAFAVLMVLGVLVLVLLAVVAYAVTGRLGLRGGMRLLLTGRATGRDRATRAGRRGSR